MKLILIVNLILLITISIGFTKKGVRLKNTLLICILCLVTSSSIAQLDIFGSFNSTYSGRNISITASKLIKKNHVLGGGLRVNINKEAHNDDQNFIYRKRLFAVEPLHFIGLEGFYQMSILRNWQHLQPFLFYNVQMSYAPTRNRFTSYAADGTIAEQSNHFGPFNWLEQNLGLGFKANLSSNWFLQQSLGFGTTFIMGYEPTILAKNNNWFEWDFGYLFNIGIGYRINKKTK